MLHGPCARAPHARADAWTRPRRGAMSSSFRSSKRRWFDLIPVRATGLDARGPALRGPTAVGALALGATALGAVAVGRLSIGRAVIKRLVIEDLDVRRLRVEELEVVTERRAAASA